MNRESSWQEAYKWLCQQRKNAPADSDVWHLRFHWERDGEAFRQRVEQGEYRLKPMRVVKRLSDDPIAMWDADDAMVLKWVALQIQDVMPVHPKCHHVKGAGVHYSRREVKNALDSGDYKFVYRTDIRGYYQHMQKNQLNALVQKWVKDPILLALVEQYIAYSVEDGGEFHTPVNGISRGCALSPLLGASLLFHVDEMYAGKTDLFYARYMDDFLVLSKKRWPLRRAIRLLNEQMNVGGFALHPDKTQIGRVKKGFDWLGLWFDEDGVRRSPRSLRMRANEILRLYEQMRYRAAEFRSLANTVFLGKTAAVCTTIIFPVCCSAVVLDAGTISVPPTGVIPDTVVTGQLNGLLPQTSGAWHVTSVRASSIGRQGACTDSVPILITSYTLAGIRVPPLTDNGASRDASVYPIYPSMPISAELQIDSVIRNGACPRYSGPETIGPFSEYVGSIYQTTTSSPSTEYNREDITLVGVWSPSTCVISDATVSFGDVSPGAVGDTIAQQPLEITPTCNPLYPSTVRPSSILFSARASESDLFTENSDHRVGVRLTTDAGQIVSPGGVINLPASGPLRLTSSLVQRSVVAGGSFSIFVDLEISYN